MQATKGEEDIARLLSDYCARNGRVILAYLFGSQVRGAAGVLSDYDIAFVMNGTVSADERYRLVHELSQLLRGRPIDLVILNTAPVELRYHVIAQGQRVYERDLAARVEFEANTLSLYGDMLPLLREQREAILSGGNRVHGVQRYRKALRQTLRMLAQIRATEAMKSE
ncbi:MAG: type VII toxin-antitoxin system MntA family adenylyltransferase antitoxin [Anaerolineae bacterium]